MAEAANRQDAINNNNNQEVLFSDNFFLALLIGCILLSSLCLSPNSFVHNYVLFFILHDSVKQIFCAGVYHFFIVGEINFNKK